MNEPVRGGTHRERSSMLEVISHPYCPFAQQIGLALREKGVLFSLRSIDLGKPPRWFTELDATGSLPILRAGHAVLESTAAIFEYLEEVYAPSLMPLRPAERARHRTWVEYCQSMLLANYTFMATPSEDVLRATLQRLRLKMERLEEHLREGPFFEGTTFTLVDIAFAPFFAQWQVFDQIGDFRLLDKLPKTIQWSNAMAARPSVKLMYNNGYCEGLHDRLSRSRSRLARLSQKQARSSEAPFELASST